MKDDAISRQVAQHKINALIDEFETIMKDIRERRVDDSVCGLCEYDGAYIGQSGDWCNECPGFERDDCFKLNKDFVTRDRLEVHEASRLADIADEIADWADKLEDDCK